MNCFKEVGEILKKWSIDIRGTRGGKIPDKTISAIEDLSKYFNIPQKFTKSFIEEFKDREGALQSIVSYRDHFVHPFLVFALGYSILNHFRKNKIYTPIFPQQGDENLKLKTWFVTSIYHDVGYPLAKLGDLIEDYSEKSFGQKVRSQFDWVKVFLSDDYVKYIDRLAEKFAQNCNGSFEEQIKYRKWFYNFLLEEKEHGVISALMLLNIKWSKEELLQITQNIKEEWEKLVYESALAISLHNWERELGFTEKPDLGTLEINNYPHAYFLSYCDIAQEWGRDIRREKKPERTDSTFWPRSQLKDMIFTQNEIKIVNKFEAKRDAIVEKNEILNITKTLREVLSETGRKLELKWKSEVKPIVKFTIQCDDEANRDMGEL